MFKLLATLKNWFSLRTLSKQFDKEVDENVNLWSNGPNNTLLQEDKEQKYFQGLGNLKHEIKKQANGSFEIFLESIGDKLLDLARHETEEQKQLRELKESVIIFKGQDVKTEEDKLNMINKRIGHYTELQKKVLYRDISRKARQAYHDGDFELVEQLNKQLEKYYGRI